MRYCTNYLKKKKKKATKIYSDLKEHVQNLSTIWKGENLVSVILLGGVSIRTSHPIHHRPQSLRRHHHPHLHLVTKGKYFTVYSSKFFP